MKPSKILTTLVLVFCLTAVRSATAQDRNIVPDSIRHTKLDPQKHSAATPQILYGVHNIGKFYQTINNNGMSGNFFGFPDVILQKAAPSFLWPRHSQVYHGQYTALWVGGVKGSDTLVSTTITENWLGWWTPPEMEFWPDLYPHARLDTRSNDRSSPYYSPQARAQQEYQMSFTDTMVHYDFIPFNAYDGRFHKPLNLEVTQTSYAWSYAYAEDFIIVDYAIRNIGRDSIKSGYAGIYYVGHVFHSGQLPYPILDDIEGYTDSIPSDFEECGDEFLGMGWCIDNDGQPNGPAWDFLSTRTGIAIAPLRVPEGTEHYNFNWWVEEEGLEYNWGPRQRGRPGAPFRDFPGGLGKPMSDKNRYYLLSHPEVDYSGYEAAKDNTGDGWLEPYEFAEDIADGHFVRYILSFGPFDLAPGAVEHLTIVTTIGDDIHTIPTAYRNVYSYANPQSFMDYLNFEDFYTNVRWAKRIFDNPGVDTDLDGDSGIFVYRFDEITGDSVKLYCTGDGVPDFRGATPPPSPPLRIDAEESKVILRWNGQATENYFDTFTGIQDFEGYRVYIGRSDRDGDVTLLASYDREDYSRYRWSKARKRFELTETPYTIEELRHMYGDNFEPLQYTIVSPFKDGDEVYYFTSVDYNNNDLADPEQIHKIYPDAEPNIEDVDEEGRMRYYEYEYVIDELLPTVPYYVAVTAFDYGFPAKALEPLESSVTQNQTKVYAVNRNGDILKDNELNVYCYPNPYRIDADYPAHGYENPYGDLPPDKARAINFVNLPPRCSISIFSLDGDLIKRIEHDQPESSGSVSIERFDMISRSRTAIESGLYYWVVESSLGTQIGKLVVIK